MSTASTLDLRELLTYVKTPVERRNIEALIAYNGNQSHAAREIGCNLRNFQRVLKRVKDRAVLRGFSPEHNRTHSVPDGYFVHGTSEYYNKEGLLSGQWVKSSVDKARQAELLQEALIGALEDYKKGSVKVLAPRIADKDLLTVYPMGDPHIGMYAWGEETGEDFDCDIAERELCAAVRTLVDRAPPSDTGLLLNLGDFFHADNMDNSTRQNKNPLDVDSRWQRVIRIGIRALIECVYAALEKHKHVIVRNMTGNHDDHSSQFLNVAMALYFENNKRVTVEDAPTHFWYHRFGRVLLGSCHGNTAKPDALPGIMSADRAEDWGQTEHRYWLTGHIHTTNRKEYHGCVWESFRTLAAKDAWHTSMGYRAGRDMQAIVYHKDFGEQERHTMNIQMLRARMKYAKSDD